MPPWLATRSPPAVAVALDDEVVDDMVMLSCTDDPAPGAMKVKLRRREKKEMGDAACHWDLQGTYLARMPVCHVNRVGEGNTCAAAKLNQFWITLWVHASALMLERLGVCNIDSCTEY